VGLDILGHAHAPRGLAVPVLSVARYDSRLPGARQRATLRAERLAAAIQDRHGHQPGQPVVVRAAIIDGSGQIEFTAAARLGCAELLPITEGHSA
jgi:Carboxysome Shell Carbonic Anhydrase.